MLETDVLGPGVAALRRLNDHGGTVRLFRTAADRPFVEVRDGGVRDGGRSVLAVIDVPTRGEATLPDVEAALTDLGWSAVSPPVLERTYLISSDADLLQIASDADTALDFLLPREFGQPLDGAHFGRYSDPGITLAGCLLSVPSMLVGLGVGSLVLLIWFPMGWERGPAWGPAILVAGLGTYLIPLVLVAATRSSDRLHDASEALLQVGQLILPAVIAAIVLIVATTAS